MSKMSGITKFGLVIGGYAAACLLAYGAVYLNSLFTDPAVAAASSGMSAFGDLILFVLAFGFFGPFPTILAIFFLIRKFAARPVPPSASVEASGE